MSLECLTLQLDLDIKDCYSLDDENEDDENLSEILEQISCDICESETETKSKSESEIITPESFLQAPNIVRSFTHIDGASENDYQALHELELIGLTKKLNISTNLISLIVFCKISTPLFYNQ